MMKCVLYFLQPNNFWTLRALLHSQRPRNNVFILLMMATMFYWQKHCQTCQPLRKYVNALRIFAENTQQVSMLGNFSGSKYDFFYYVFGRFDTNLRSLNHRLRPLNDRFQLLTPVFGCHDSFFRLSWLLFSAVMTPFSAIMTPFLAIMTPFSPIMT